MCPPSDGIRMTFAISLVRKPENRLAPGCDLDSPIGLGCKKLGQVKTEADIWILESLVSS